MPRLGITGHRGLLPATSRLVETALRHELAKLDPTELVGVSSLADGADALFAQAVLDQGGRLEAIVPAAEYRAGLPAEHHPTYDRLMTAASDVQKLGLRESTPEAHMAAAKTMLERIDELFAVWDGLPARGYGGTADVVHEAQTRGVPVRVIWPRGTSRD